ncbi:hypothetical protein DRJ16_07245 [Candidatus Woesearchaeota archaeon]|nr:MAG: hypothetical protein DRJ16_07245 [Candidatus Woesearchaeota archaeon]
MVPVYLPGTSSRSVKSPFTGAGKAKAAMMIAKEKANANVLFCIFISLPAHSIFFPLGRWQGLIE